MDDCLIRDVRFGKYLIRNVPHFEQNGKTVYTSRTLLKLTAIVSFMEAAEEATADFRDWA